MLMFKFLAGLLVDANHKAAYVLTMICIAMIIDFATGTIVAKINPILSLNQKLELKVYR